MPPIPNLGSLHATPMVRNTRYNGDDGGLDTLQLDKNSTARNSAMKYQTSKYGSIGRNLAATEMRTDISNNTFKQEINTLASQQLSKQRLTPSAIGSLN